MNTNIYIYIYIYIYIPIAEVLLGCKYLSLPHTRQDLTQGQKPEGRLSSSGLYMSQGSQTTGEPKQLSCGI